MIPCRHMKKQCQRSRIRMSTDKKVMIEVRCDSFTAFRSSFSLNPEEKKKPKVFNKLW